MPNWTEVTEMLQRIYPGLDKKQVTYVVDAFSWGDVLYDEAMELEHRVRKAMRALVRHECTCYDELCETMSRDDAFTEIEQEIERVMIAIAAGDWVPFAGLRPKRYRRKSRAHNGRYPSSVDGAG